jgi:PilZ domain-containing protein
MGASKQSLEHRWGSRVHLRKPAALHTNHGPDSHAVLRNVSLSGAFVETGLKPALFSRVAVQLTDGNWCSLDAWVVRTDVSGVGLEWLEPGSETAVALLSRPRHAAP